MKRFFSIIICFLSISLSLSAQENNDSTFVNPLQGVLNFRDFGGYQIGDKHVKSGVLFRSSNLSAATDDDLSYLQDSVNIRMIFDFRTTEELLSNPNRLQDNVLYASLPSLEDAIKRFQIPENRESTSKDPFINYADYYIDSISTKNVRQLAHAFYPYIIRSRVFQDQIGYELIDTLVSLPEGQAALFHCTNGTNRAGWAVTFILAALGADRETLIQEFMKSNIPFKNYLEYAEKKAIEKGLTEDQIEEVKSLVGVSRKNLESALDMIDKNYGSMDSYLTKQLKLTDEKRELLKARFLE